MAEIRPHVIVIGSFEDLHIGQVIEGLNDQHAETHTGIRMKVVGFSTWAAWRDDVAAMGGDTASCYPPEPGAKYYEVLTD